MSRMDLIELAALDALGLLDEIESDLFDRSFHHASATVQDEVREIQARVVEQISHVCSEEPPASLRERVLQAVAEAVELDSPAPLASIRRAGDRTASAYDHAGESDDARRVRRLQLAGHFWRAACFILLGVVVSVVFMLVNAQNANNQLAYYALNSNLHDQLERHIGPTFRAYLRDGTAERIVLSSTNEDCDGWANLWIAEGTTEAMLITEGLPELDEGQTYQLRVRDVAGRVRVIANVAAGELIRGSRITVDSSTLVAVATWELAGPNGVVLSS
jgi:hypothetical protein